MKKKILDIMIDFETFGRQPNSVPINLAVVAWNRYAEENPFVIPKVGIAGEYPGGSEDLPLVSSMPIFNPDLNHSRFVIFHFDVCACAVSGMIIEPETMQWWRERAAIAKDSLFIPGRNQQMPWSVVRAFVEWLKKLKDETEVDEICIWSQGSDFDIAKLRWLVEQYCASVPKESIPLLSHTLFRDARTVILELGAKLFDGKRGFHIEPNSGVIITDDDPNTEQELYEFSNIYDRMPTIESWIQKLQKKDGIATGSEGVMSNYLFHLASSGYAHNSIYDCMRSIYNVWWLNQALDTQMV